MGPSDAPKTESLTTSIERVMLYCGGGGHDINPQLVAGRLAFVAASNSTRAIVKYIDGIPDDALPAWRSRLACLRCTI